MPLLGQCSLQTLAVWPDRPILCDRCPSTISSAANVASGSRRWWLCRSGQRVRRAERRSPSACFSPISGPLKTGLHGAAARRSNAARHARDEQLREGFASKRGGPQAARRKLGGRSRDDLRRAAQGGRTASSSNDSTNQRVVISRVRVTRRSSHRSPSLPARRRACRVRDTCICGLTYADIGI